MRIPQKVADRIASGLKRFQPILQAAHARDINESDTVVIVTDVLQYVLGYDKYTEITSEHAIRGTYCDLAIKIDGRLALLIEVKPIGHELVLELNLLELNAKRAADIERLWLISREGVQKAGLAEYQTQTEEISAVLVNEVLKREVLEGDRASAAKRLVTRAAGRTLRRASPQPATPSAPQPAPPTDVLPPTT